MKLNTLRILFFSLSLIYFSGEPARVSAEEDSSILERILNPLPEYDPFNKPSPAPQYFPDDVDKRARESLIDSLTGNDGALENHLRFFLNKDAELKQERGSETGLTEYVLDLRNNSVQDRQGYLAAQEKALASASPRQRQIIESRLRNDDFTQAESLISDSATNRWGGIFNRFLSSVDLVSIASGSYVGAAVDSAISQLLSIGPSEMPVEERKALALYLEQLKRYPDDPQNADLRKKIEVLEKRKKDALVRSQIEKASESLKKGDLDQAGLHYEIASLIDPSSQAAQERMEHLKVRLKEQEQEKRKSLLASAEQGKKTGDSPEDEAAAGLLYALALGDPAQIDAHAKTVQEKFHGTPLADTAKDAAAAAFEMVGHHEEAKKILQEIARSSNDPKEERRAETLLGSPEYNLLASFEEARSQHRLETVKYVPS